MTGIAAPHVRSRMEFRGPSTAYDSRHAGFSAAVDRLAVILTLDRERQWLHLRHALEKDDPLEKLLGVFISPIDCFWM
jgi:hypothetical protein